MLHGDSEEYERLGVLSMHPRGRQRNSRLHRSGIPTWSRCRLHDSLGRRITDVRATRGLSKCRSGLVSVALTEAEKIYVIEAKLGRCVISRSRVEPSLDPLVLRAFGSQLPISRWHFAVTSENITRRELNALRRMVQQAKQNCERSLIYSEQIHPGRNFERFFSIHSTFDCTFDNTE